MMKSWMHHKSMESCLGEDMMKTSLLKCKKAVVKCTGVDAPELDLPMFKSPHRMVHALLQSAEEHKQTQMLSAMQQMHKQNSNDGGNNPTIQLVLGGAQQQQAQPENGRINGRFFTFWKHGKFWKQRNTRLVENVDAKHE